MMSMEAPHKRPEAIDIAVILSRMLPPFENRVFGAEFRWFNSVTLCAELHHVGRAAPPLRHQRDERAAPHGSLSFQARGRRLPTCAGGPSRCLRPHAPQPRPSLCVSAPLGM